MAAGKVAGPELDIHRLYKAHKSKMEIYVPTARQKSAGSLTTGESTTSSAVWNQHVLRNVPTKRAALQQGINRLNSSAFGRLRPSPLGGPRARPLGTSRSASAMMRGKRFHHLQDFLLGEDFFQDDDELAMTCMKLHEVVVVGTASKMSAREAKPDEKTHENVENSTTTSSIFPVQLPAIERQKSLIEPAQEATMVAAKRSLTKKHLSNKLARKKARRNSSRAWEQPRPESSNSDQDLDSSVESQPQKPDKTTKRNTSKVVTRTPNFPDQLNTENATETSILTTSRFLPTHRSRLTTAPVLKLSPLTYFEVDRQNLCISDTPSLTTTTNAPQTVYNRARRASEPVITTTAPPELEKPAVSPRKSIIRARSTDGAFDSSSSDSDGGRPETKRCSRTVRFMGMEVKIYAPDAPVIEISHKG